MKSDSSQFDVQAPDKLLSRDVSPIAPSGVDEDSESSSFFSPLTLASLESSDSHIWVRYLFVLARLSKTHGTALFVCLLNPSECSQVIYLICQEP